MPDADDVKVQNLNVRSSKEDEESNTFAVDLTWDRPPFKYRDVMYYNLSYEITSLLRNQFPCSSLLVNTRCTISGLVSIEMVILFFMVVIIITVTMFVIVFLMIYFTFQIQ